MTAFIENEQANKYVRSAATGGMGSSVKHRQAQARMKG